MGGTSSKDEAQYAPKQYHHHHQPYPSHQPSYENHSSDASKLTLSRASLWRDITSSPRHYPDFDEIFAALMDERTAACDLGRDVCNMSVQTHQHLSDTSVGIAKFDH